MDKELSFKLNVCLRRLIVKEKEDHQLIEFFNLDESDEEKKREIITRVMNAMAFPRETILYNAELKNQGTEAGALQSVEIEGLIALAFLGQKQIIPRLLKSLRDDKTRNTRRRIVARAALCHLTRQEVGTKFLFDEDLDLWEVWWGQNN